MREGIYRLRYETSVLNDTGVLLLENQTVAGCDRCYFMFGTYEQEGSRFHGTVTFQRHTEPQGLQSVIIPAQFDLSFDGICGDDFGQLEVQSRDVPIIRGHATFTRLLSAEYS